MDNKSNKPKVSVVTVCFNAVKEIEKTMISVLNQTYPNVEYIVIDGGSTDGTVDIIKKYAGKLAYWVSEPDGGIYYGMNKGIKVATGEWLEFLNSGDYFYSNTSLEDLMSKHSNPQAGVLYGYQVHKYPYGDFVRIHMPLENFRSYMPIGHPSSFVKLSLIKDTGFDTNYRIAADYNMFYKLYHQGVQFESIDTLVAVFDSYSGVSSVSPKTLIETATINGRIKDKDFLNELSTYKRKNWIKSMISRIAPKLVLRIQEKKRNNNREYITLKDYLKSHEA